MALYNNENGIFWIIFFSALRDSIAQGAYKGKKSILLKKGALDKTQTALKEFADEVLSGKLKDQSIYNAKLLAVSSIAINEINTLAEQNGDEARYTFGNAQKLINMTMKYLYLSTYKQYAARDNFACCHCPMDDQLIKYVWKNKKKLSKETKQKMGLSADFNARWNLENMLDAGSRESRYLVFQQAVRELVEELKENDCQKAYPVEFDFLIWNAE